MAGKRSADLEILACPDDEVRDIVSLTLFSLNAHSGQSKRQLPSGAVHGRVTLKDLLRELGLTANEAHLEFSRKRIPLGFRDSLQRLVNRCLTEADKAYLFSKIPRVRSERFEYEAAIKRTFDASDPRFQNLMSVGQIYDLCTQHKNRRLKFFGRPVGGRELRPQRDSYFRHGYYVLFTAETAQNTTIGFRLAAMEVLCEHPFNSRAKRFALPIFKTERYDMPTEAVVDGIMLQPGDSVYTVGQIRGRRIMRVSKLNFLHRPEKPGRYDLYGLRLAHKKQLPSCHRIFAYQIVSDNRIEKAIDLMRAQAADETKKGVFDDRVFENLGIDERIKKRIIDYLCTRDTNSFDLDAPALT